MAVERGGRTCGSTPTAPSASSPGASGPARICPLAACSDPARLDARLQSEAVRLTPRQPLAATVSLFKVHATLGVRAPPHKPQHGFARSHGPSEEDFDGPKVNIRSESGCMAACGNGQGPGECSAAAGQCPGECEAAAGQRPVHGSLCKRPKPRRM